MKRGWQQAIAWLELGILGLFTAEYVLRLWIAERPWKYAFSFYGVIDLAAILPFYLAWATGVASFSWTPDHCAEEVSGWQKAEKLSGWKARVRVREAVRRCLEHVRAQPD